MCICMFEISFLGTMGPSHCPLAMSWLGHPYPTVIIVVQDISGSLCQRVIPDYGI